MDSNEPVKQPTKSNSSGLRVGPGFLITAAFIGPGTVVSASSAGYKFSLHLGWVVLLSTLAAIILQAMAGRLGVVTRLPLGQIVNDAMPNLAARIAMSLLIFLAILFGNTAYQSGNLMGGVQGADLLAGGVMLQSTWFSLSALTIGAIIAGTLLWTGNPKVVSRFLIGLVVLMSLTFVGMAAIILFRQPFDVAAWLPRIPAGSEATTPTTPKKVRL